MRPWTNKTLGFGVLGLLLVVGGISLCFFGPSLFQFILESEMKLSPNSRSFEVWKDTSKLPPMHLKFYFFNWTNPEELRIPGKKPNLVEVGPYSFREVKKKFNITFHPENSTVSYFQRRFWTFDPSASNGSLNDKVIQLNVVAVSAAHKTRYWSIFMQNSLSYVLSSSSQLYIVKSIDELLFTGYDDTVIKMGKLAVAEDDIPPFDRFGWFYKRNGSYEIDGHFNMATGEDDIKNLGVIKNWNYRDTTKFFRSPCNVIEGSAGEFWPPHRTKDDVTMFSVDLCRPITYEYTETAEYLGVKGYKFSLGGKTFGNDTRRRYPHDQAKYFEAVTTTEDFFNAEHSAEANTKSLLEDDPDTVNLGYCYCNGECTPSGLINITACRYGAPAFVSLPHFYKGDPVLLDQVHGLRPSSDHDFYIILEPTTGVPLRVAARFQVNILLQPSKTISLFKDVPKIFFPILWFSMDVALTEDVVSNISMFLLLPDICLYTSAAMALVGSLMLLAIAVLHYVNGRSRVPLNSKLDYPDSTSIEKEEIVYMDKVNTNDDSNARTDRQLYPKLY
ncbi:protein croquemort-like [Prorops nasuta]|uniref:protein croquemort-like n=1 Tax=Prorops nasuta TaxID=863751 RepID=UPI0034CD1716